MKIDCRSSKRDFFWRASQNRLWGGLLEKGTPVLGLLRRPGC